MAETTLFDRQTRVLTAETIQYNSGGTSTSNLPRGGLMYGLQINLNGVCTMTAFANTLAAVKRGSAWGIIKNVSLKAEGSKELFSMSGADLWWYNRNFWGTNPATTYNIGDTVTANPAVGTTLFIPSVLSQAYNPDDTTLDTRKYSSLQLQVTWGLPTDISSGCTAFTGSIDVNPFVFVRTASTVADEPSRPLARRFVIEKALSVGNDQRFDLPTGYIYRELLINTRDTSTNFDSQNAARFKLVSGNDTIFDYSSGRARQFALMKRSIPQFVSSADWTLASAALQRNNFESDFSWYPIDLAFLGRMSECPDTRNWGDFALKIDVGTAATTARVICTVIDPTNV